MPEPKNITQNEQKCFLSGVQQKTNKQKPKKTTKPFNSPKKMFKTMKIILMWFSFTNGVPYWRKITTLLKTDDNSVLRSWMKLWARKLIALILPMHVCMLSHFSRDRLCATLWTAAHQALLSTGFSRQEHRSGLPFPSPNTVYHCSIISYSIRRLIINLFWSGKNSPRTACGWQQACRSLSNGYRMEVTVLLSRLLSFKAQSEIFLSFTTASWQHTSCWRW